MTNYDAARGGEVSIRKWEVGDLNLKKRISNTEQGMSNIEG
jgi:hypothetical protein